MNRFQLKVVPNDRATPIGRRLTSGSTWRFQTLSPCASRRKRPSCRRFPARSGHLSSTIAPLRPALWLKSRRLHPTICRQRTQQRLSSPSLRKPGANRHPAAAIRSARASARMNRFGWFIISGARHQTLFPRLLASKPGSRSNPFSCSITPRPSMLWYRGCPRRQRNDVWLLTSSPNQVRFV